MNSDSLWNKSVYGRCLKLEFRMFRRTMHTDIFCSIFTKAIILKAYAEL